jgi:APA family basic amino acid/polyamine antiporter
MRLKRQLSSFDLTNIVIGSVVGADIYIACALTAGMIGPFSIFVWIIGGILASVIALVFAYCSYYVPKVGGPFAYVSKAFDDFYGFLAGWSMWIAELLALSVFAIAAVNYLQYFIPLTLFQQILIKAIFFFVLTYVNIIGVKHAGRFNDVLTILKLIPLFLLIVAGILFLFLNPHAISKNYLPFAPLGLSGFGTALVIIFWAYAGFELGTLPAGEVKNPRKTIPRAIILGMSIVMLFYVLINFSVFGTVNWKILQTSSIPLVIAGSFLFGAIGAAIMAIGAIISTSGVDEVALLGTARLSYAMSIHGLFPKIFSRVHPKYRTPYMALIIQGLVAFCFSLISAIPALISFSVFNLAFSFLLTCLALVVLKKSSEHTLHGQNILPWFGVLICLYLMYSVSMINKIVGTVIIILGIPIYVYFSPKEVSHHLRRRFVHEENLFSKRMERSDRFLARFIRLMHRTFSKSGKGKGSARQ